MSETAAQTEARLALPASDAAVVELRRRAQDVERTAQEMVVASDADAEAASVFLVDVASAAKAVEKRRKFFVEPLNAHVKAINDLFKRLSSPFASAEAVVKAKIVSYRQERQRIADEERRRLEAEERERQRAAAAARAEADAAAARAAEEKRAEGRAEAERAAFEAHLAASRAEEQAARAAVVAQAVAAAPEAPKTIATGDGARVTARKRWTFAVVNANVIPRRYLVVDERKIRADIAAGVREILGVRVFEEESIAVSGR